MFPRIVAHIFASNGGALVVGTQRIVVVCVFERHVLNEAVSVSLPSVISAMLITRPRAASTLIQPKTLMEHNEPHSFPAAYQTLSRDSVTTKPQCRSTCNGGHLQLRDERSKVFFFKNFWRIFKFTADVMCVAYSQTESSASTVPLSWKNSKKRNAIHAFIKFL